MQSNPVCSLCRMIMMVILLTPAAVSASTWNINPEHSSIQFQVSYMSLVNVKGSFDKFQGVVTLDEKDPAKSVIEVAIESASINTGVAKRDEHLRTDDFFDCPKYPDIRFVSKKVVPAGKQKLKVTGDLTMLGVTREVVLQVDGPTPEIKDPWGNIRRGASARTRINRQDFGMTWNRVLDAGGVMIGKLVDVIMEVELIKADEKQPS
jgi:polyisoprenoid-binding protein YceI